MNASPKENKHVACSRCRERKVKCDGGKPTCKRCQRHGQTCQYMSGRKPQAKSQWTRHLRTFSATPGMVIFFVGYLSVLISTLDKKDGSIPSQHISSPTYSMNANEASELGYDDFTSSTRSSSPHCNGLDTRPSSSWSTTPYSFNGPHETGNKWFPGSIASSLATEDGFPDSNAFNFNNGTSFCNTNYVSNNLSTYPTSTYTSTTMMRSTTPTSQASGTPSFDGSFDP
jgi:hypothetical protein